MSTDPKSTYYDWGGIEALEVCKRKLTITEYIGALKFNILRYTMRMEHKGSAARDAEKVAVYSKELEKAQAALGRVGKPSEPAWEVMTHNDRLYPSVAKPND